MHKLRFIGSLLFITTAVVFAQVPQDHAKNGTAGDRSIDPAKPNEKYLSLCNGSGNAAHATEPQKLDAKTLAVYDILKQKCARCHNPGSNRGATSFSDILDVEHLAAKGIIKPGNAAESTLIQSIEDDSMPLSGKKLSKDEKQTLKDWIKDGAKTFSTSSTEIPEVGFISNGDLEACMVKDLRNIDEQERPFIRYLNLANLYNASRKGELERTRLAINKLLNSLSWEKNIKNPVIIDGTHTLIRLDLRDYTWTPELWEEIARVNPYPEAIESAKEKELTERAGTRTPALRGDWVVSAASKPPLYETLLQLPKKEGNIGADTALENKLLIDTVKNEKNGRMVRAGFSQSNVTKSNRIMDRHDTPFGSYWKSADFKTKEGKQNVFDHPLDFERNGGEYIWSLPNGTHGYQVTDAKGNALPAVPPEIANDPHRIYKDGLVINGVSCMSCHQKGINRHDDEILNHYTALETLLAKSNPNPNLSALIKDVKRIFKGNEILKRKYDEDEKAYAEAMRKTGNSVNDPDPVSLTADNFDAPLDIRSIAAELGHEAKEVDEAIKTNLNLRQRLAFGTNATVDRDTFNANFRLLKNILEGHANGGGAPGVVVSDPKFDPHFEFVGISPGTFTMGSPSTEKDRSSDEVQHEVTIKKGFDMQTTPVTQSLWEKVMGSNPSSFKDPNRPVEEVSWNDAQEFIKKLNQLRKGDGFKYRLPTEAEWELAARGGTKTAYSFGDSPGNGNETLKEFAWFTDNSGNKSQVVGTRKPNPFGLFDMHGNVWQWVEDGYQANLGTGAVTDPKIDTGSFRVLRGGSWSSFARFLRSARRDDGGPDLRNSVVGFRLVRTPE